jgi:radical SAM superfamily enzyme YgiQ (UPF0313 family)
MTATFYEGFEQGPIRPPSEADSLLIRVTRNCPWNRCRFCPVYKGQPFSLRPVADVLADIDAVHRYVAAITAPADGGPPALREGWRARAEAVRPADPAAFQAARHWAAGGLASIFLQDANSLILPPADLVRVLEHLQARFPWEPRITSYARSRTVERIPDADLARMARAGLSRIHIGMESGSDEVLRRMAKGVTKAGHIKAGRKIVAAGMELSEYIMPGLGGRELSREHALETADALNRIDPHFIRLRTLAIPGHTELAADRAAGRFTKLGEVETAAEILLLLTHLEGIGSFVVSDHILNLFEDLQGRLPEDRERLTGILRAFLGLPAEERVIYQVGRRMGLFRGLADLARPGARQRVEEVCRQVGIGPENAEAAIDELMKRFI